jgi:hypothetical protein
MFMSNRVNAVDQAMEIWNVFKPGGSKSKQQFLPFRELDRMILGLGTNPYVCRGDYEPCSCVIADG